VIVVARSATRVLLDTSPFISFAETGARCGRSRDTSQIVRP